MRFWFEVSDVAIAAALAKELGVELHTLGAARQKRFSRKAGPGFGDHVWRVNYALDRIEASFDKPCTESKMLKANFFKFDWHDGVWYSQNTHDNATICKEVANLTQIESVLRR